jgi:hypothetical protein
MTRIGLTTLCVMSPLCVAAQGSPEVNSAPTTASVSQAAAAQAPRLSLGAYVPMTGRERVDWIVDGTIAPLSLGVGVIATAWQTGWNSPEEWGRSGAGIGKRYLQREADVTISNTIEAGAGALWGEDPRPLASGRRGFWPRTRFALKTAWVAPRRDGRLKPAWGRYAGNVFNNLIENTWLPPSATTPGQTTLRSVNGMVSRMIGNMWFEFWPDIRRRLRR